MQSFLDKVNIGLTKDSLSIVDEQLNVDDVRAIFGQHVKLISHCVTNLGKTINQPQLKQ